MHIIYNVNINPLRPWTSSHTEEIGYTLIYLGFINIEKFTILMINVLEYVDIAICNRISYFDNFLNLAKKWMKIGCSRNIEETTVVYAITVFHTVLVCQHIIEDTCSCTIVWFTLYIHVCWLICISLLGFTKGMVAKLECIFIFVSTFLVFILESGIKMIFFLNFMMFICFMLQWFGQRLYQMLHVKVWRWRNWKIDVHRNVLWKLQMRKYSF